MHGEHGREVPRTAGAAAKHGSSGFSRHAFRRGVLPLDLHLKRLHFHEVVLVSPFLRTLASRA
jgi:hypothetical protein